MNFYFFFIEFTNASHFELEQQESKSCVLTHYTTNQFFVEVVRFELTQQTATDLQSVPTLQRWRTSGFNN